MMRHHFHGWPFFGMTPKLLTWRKGNGGDENEPATLPKDTSLAKYSSITVGCACAEGLFLLSDLRG